MRGRTPCSLLLLPLLLAACGEQPAAPPVEPLPFVRQTVPDDGIDIGDEPSFNLSVTFSGPADPAQVGIQLFPPADSTGAQQWSPTHRNLTWFEVDFGDTTRVQRFLVHGTGLRRPSVVSFLLDSARQGAIRGRVSSADSSRVTPRQCLAFAIRSSEPFNTLDPATFHQVRKDQLAVADESQPDGTAIFQIDWMPAGVSFLVIAIADSDGDGQYDPVRDWWGFHKLEGQIQPRPVLAGESAFAPASAPLQLRAP